MNAPDLISRLLPAWETFGTQTDITIIRNQSHYDYMTTVLESLLDEIGGDEKHPLMVLVDVVGNLIQAYEASLPGGMVKPTGVDALKFLMQQHGLKQGDLPEIGSQGVVSEILAGKRDLNVRQIRALCRRFAVSAETFV